jgi:hypothetical protein
MLREEEEKKKKKKKEKPTLTEDRDQAQVPSKKPDHNPPSKHPPVF